MQKAIIAELLEGLNAAMEWAATGCTRCRERLDGETRVFDLCKAATVVRWIDEAAHGKPLTPAQIATARKVIALAQWHRDTDKRRVNGRRRAGGI